MTQRTDYGTGGETGWWYAADAIAHAEAIDTNAAAIAANNASLAAKADATRAITTQHSLTGGGTLAADRTINLVGDTASPGNTKLYGTNGSGARGWYDQPTGGGGGGSFTDNGDGTGTITAGTPGADTITKSMMTDDSVGINELDVAGTPNGSQFLRDDFQWATPAGSSSLSRAIGSSFRAAPTVTDSAVNIGTTISGYTAVTGGTAIGWASAAGKWRWIGMTPTTLPSDSGYCTNDILGLGVSNALYGPIEFEFYSDFTELRLHFWSLAKGDAWILVDDQRISLNSYYHPNVGSDGIVTVPVTQTGGLRKWRICLHNTSFRGISVNSGARVVPTMQAAPQWAVISDSWWHGGIVTNSAVSVGVAGGIGAGSLRGTFEQHTGVEIWNLAVGSTGYVNHGIVGSPNGTYGSTKRLTSLAALPAMDLIMFFGTANDSGNSGATVVAAAQTAWAAVKTARPSTPIIVVGLEHFGDTEAWGDLATINSALKTAAEADTNVTAFIDLRETTHQFFTGTGRDGALSGSGNRDVGISNDNIHQTHFGYDKMTGPQLARLMSTIPIPADITGGAY